jgi:hypothetical protein
LIESINSVGSNKEVAPQGLLAKEVVDDDFDEDVPIPETSPEAISFFTFFRYMTPTDKVLMGIGTFSAVAAGCILPSISIVMASVAEAFTSSNPNTSPKFNMGFIASIVVIIACALFTFAYMFFAFWQ